MVFRWILACSLLSLASLAIEESPLSICEVFSRLDLLDGRRVIVRGAFTIGSEVSVMATQLRCATPPVDGRVASPQAIHLVLLEGVSGQLDNFRAEVRRARILGNGEACGCASLEGILEVHNRSSRSSTRGDSRGGKGFGHLGWAPVQLVANRCLKFEVHPWKKGSICDCESRFGIK